MRSWSSTAAPRLRSWGSWAVELSSLHAPTLVLWGDKDPYTQPRMGDYYKQALSGDVRVEHLPDAGHWVWFDRPDVIDKTVDFLSTG